tara:strand:- start:849 stop:1613 length:765 start_codon:yes stop_codon:yes gene_type:complete
MHSKKLKQSPVIKLSDYINKKISIKNGIKVRIKGDIMNKIVNAAMLKHGFTQASLAREMEKPPETLNRWLQNKQQASREDILKLAELLKLPPGVVQFEPEPIKITTARKKLRREVTVLKNPEKLHLPTNFPSFFVGQKIVMHNPTSMSYGSIDLFDMQNKGKAIDERSINNWSMVGCDVDGKEKLLTGRLMPRADAELFDVVGEWEIQRSTESKEYLGMTVLWACPCVVTLQKQFIDTYTNGKKNNYSNQGYSV